MKPQYLNILLVFFFGVTSCDPVHQLHLVNDSRKNIDVIIFPKLDSTDLSEHRGKSLQLNGQDMSVLTLAPSESLCIGHVFARYTPRVDDVTSDFIEIHIGQDTIRLASKDTIFSRLQKEKNLDWRLTVKD